MGCRDRHEHAELWRVRIVTRHAMVSLSWSAAQVPITAHTAVGAMVVIALLRAVTLRAQLHRIRQSDQASIGQVQLVARARFVTRRAGQRSMLHAQACVGPLYILRAFWKRARVGTMAGTTGRHARTTGMIERAKR